MKKIAIITLCYNKAETATKPYLDSLYKFTNPEEFDLFLIDNASSDDTTEYIENFKKDKNNIIFIKNPVNTGYSKGNNLGITKALKKDYDFIALLNNDILFTPDWLKTTLEAFNEDETLGMVSPRNNEKCKLTTKNYLEGYKKYLSRFKTPLRYVVTPFFSCVVIKKEVFQNIGIFDENYSPAFFEDNDLSFRAMYKGYSLAYCNKSFIFHNHSQTSKDVKNDIIERNKKYFFKKHPLGKYIWEHKRTNVVKDIIKYVKEGNL